MEISPQSIRSIDFRSTKKGYDPDEVDQFRTEVAAALEAAQQQAATMEARARAAIAKLQDLSQQSPGAAVAPASGGDAEVISRTLVLAQRTADAAIEEARAEAESLLHAARDEAARTIEAARSAATKVADEARVEARRGMEDERLRAENEVQALLARRDFLLGDVDQLEQYIVLQRERMREVAGVLHDLAERVPGGLGDMRRPLMSASAHTASTHTGPTHTGSTHTAATVTEPEALLPVTPLAPVNSEAPAGASSLASTSSSSSASTDRDDVWRLLDETGEVATSVQPAAQVLRPTTLQPLQPVTPSVDSAAPVLPTLQQGIQGALFQPEAVTAELPITDGPSADAFRIRGDELQ